MSFDALHERLSALQETTAQLKELVDRLAGLRATDGEDDSVAAELSAEISQVLREEEEDLELLREEVTDLRAGRPGSESGHAKARLEDGVSRLDRELKSYRVAFRKAQISARKFLEQARRLDRELLLAVYASSAAPTPQNNRSGATSPGGQGEDEKEPQQQKQAGNGDARRQLFPPHHKRRHQQRDNSGGAAVAASSDVTAALRRTHDLIAGELSRSSFARQTLAESTAALGQLRESYAGLDGLLASSRELAGALLTSTKSDTWYLETALYALLATLAWLIFRRWLYGPLWWVLWLPLRTVWTAGSAVSSRVGGGGGEMPHMAVPAGGAAPERAGLAGSSVPTVRTAVEVDAETPYSMVDKVARVVRDADEQVWEEQPVGQEDEKPSGSENERPSGSDVYEDYEPNPKKRMWEEEVEERRVRDEL